MPGWKVCCRSPTFIPITVSDDSSHWANRALVPMFYLLREDSIARAVIIAG